MIVTTAEPDATPDAVRALPATSSVKPPFARWEEDEVFQLDEVARALAGAVCVRIVTEGGSTHTSGFGWRRRRRRSAVVADQDDVAGLGLQERERVVGVGRRLRGAARVDGRIDEARVLDGAHRDAVPAQRIHRTVDQVDRDRLAERADPAAVVALRRERRDLEAPPQRVAREVARGIEPERREIRRARRRPWAAS